MRHDVVITSPRFHAHRAARRHRDHRGVDRAPAAGGAGGARGGPADPVRQQPEAARTGHPQLPRRQQQPAAGPDLVADRRRGLFPTIFSGTPEHDLVLPDAPPVRTGEPGQFVQLQPRRGGLAGHGPRADGFFANSTVAATKISVFQCPSDRNNSFQINPLYSRRPLSSRIFTKGNYGVSWGNTNWAQSFRDGPGQSVPPIGVRPPGEHQPGQHHRRHEQHGLHRRGAPGRAATTSAA